MNNTIGKKPIRYYTFDQIKTFKRWELMLIVQENGWEYITGIHKWEDIGVEDIRIIINNKMNEYLQKVEHGPRQTNQSSE